MQYFLSAISTEGLHFAAIRIAEGNSSNCSAHSFCYVSGILYRFE